MRLKPFFLAVGVAAVTLFGAAPALADDGAGAPPEASPVPSEAPEPTASPGTPEPTAPEEQPDPSPVPSPGEGAPVPATPASPLPADPNYTG
ncbi:hypothetical protein KIK06_23275 [Nocardiopsis sp. EMB25]|uniref:hypothetical protein n=1 Tax=Nocardiopsis TaxID=2013 RepID=UPI00034DB79E|nr:MULTISPECIES: hypothetical protein [Nocardiopsis]MCY9786808.1 hypothetical protein [Nocardiopsis sp. EMB25]